MSTQANAVPNLAALLERHTIEIATSWTDLIYQPSADSLDRANRPTTLEHTKGSLLAIAHALRTGSYTALEDHLTNINRLNMQSGASIEVVVETLLLLTNAALPVILRAFPPGSKAMTRAISQLDSSLRWMTGYLARLHSSEQSKLFRERQERAEMMLGIAREVSRSLELDDVLSRVCESMAEAVGGCQCRLYLVDDGRPVPVINRLEEPAPYSVHAALVIESRMPAILGRGIPNNQRPAASGCAEDAQQVIAVPFMVRNRPVAAAILCPSDASRAFAKEEVDVAWGIARIVAPVVDNARRHQQVEQLMTRQERDRLSRELHDNLAQALSTLNLKVTETGGLLSANKVGSAQDALQEMREIIQAAYTDVREAIFNLRDGGMESTGFLPALREYLSDYRLHYGIDARLKLDSDSLPELAANARLQVIRIIQEALTNVRKHAQVSEAVVDASVDGDRLHVCISDEGVGFDPALIGGADRRRYGLQTMAERAESVGGSVVYDSQPARGTRVIVRVPYAAKK